MQKIPPIKEIDGFKVEVLPRDVNLASGEDDEGSELLEDWYWRINIVCDGSNPNWAEPFEETLYVSRLSRINDPPNIDSELPAIILSADDSPLEIRLEELMIKETLGLWCTVSCETPLIEDYDGILDHMMFIEELPDVVGMTMN